MVSSSLASSSVVAVVQMQMSMPRILSTLSYSISREDQLFLQTEGIVAAAVKGIGVDAPEVADPRQSHAEQTIEELIHSLAAQRDLHTDGLAFTDLEVRDGLASLRRDGLLAGDGGEVTETASFPWRCPGTRRSRRSQRPSRCWGICMVLLYWNFCMRAGATSSLYFAFRLGQTSLTPPLSDFSAAVLADTDLLAVHHLAGGAGGLVAWGRHASPLQAYRGASFWMMPPSSPCLRGLVWQEPR